MKNEIKIAEPKEQCLHPEHEPAKNIVRTPGTYQHTCPGCGKVEVFEVPLITC